VELEQKSANLKSKTISRDVLSKFAVITDCKSSEIVEFVEYWRDKGDFDGVKAYITSRVENSLTERIKQSILAQKEENNAKTN
jgi:hypothetical protein